MADQALPAAVSPRPRSRADTRAGRIFISPTVLALLVLGVFPLLFILAAALTESSLGKPFKEFTGTANFATVLGDGDVVASLWRTAGYSIGVTAASVVLGVLTATAVYQAARSGSLVRTLLLLPLIVPPVVVGTLWKLIFNPAGGLLATLLGFAGISIPAPLSDSRFALGAVMLADIWEWTPLVFLLVFAALLGQDHSVIEAARLDGAHGRRLFASVTWPAIAGTVAAAAFIRLVLALKVFDLIHVMTSGGPGQSTTTVSALIHQAALKEFDVGRASAITVLLALLMAALTLPLAALTASRRRREEAAA